VLKIIKKIDFKFNSTIPIFKNCNYSDFLKGKYPEPEDVLVCPTDALDIDQKEISLEKCVECLLCPYYLPSKTIKYSEENSLEKFMEFVNSDKKYLTKWIGQAISTSNSDIKCGFDVKIQSGSRTKRIPLLIIIENKPLILKVVDSFKDIEYGVLSLEEIEEGIKQYDLQLPGKIIVTNEIRTKYDEELQEMVTKLKEKHNFELIFAESIWNTVKEGWLATQVEWKKIFCLETR
jgi:Pyruvate/2-oxoacid:ferredoxin oxidoreductase delta subunit